MEEKEEKKRIRPVIVEEDGEKLPSVDSISQVEEVQEVASNILSEETKDEVVTQERKPDDIGIVQPHVGVEKRGNKLTITLVIVLVALITALLAGGIYVYINGTQGIKDSVTDLNPLPAPTPQATEKPEPKASPTPEVKVDLSKLKVNILNGSGKIGEAGKVKTLIEKEGFKVLGTGNAPAFDFEETVISVKETVDQSVVDKLKDILSETYKVDIGDNLKSSNTYDIVITVGSK